MEQIAPRGGCQYRLLAAPYSTLEGYQENQAEKFERILFLRTIKGTVAKYKIFTRYCTQHFKDIFIL